ncbi:23S ribosomal RNA methyltransferase Erm [Candidatus Shapirobacteria bacterium]|nr:23S ribosomal RNA methyltransferase Erm [Candidatus Shapirobacteria bacterium]
MVYHQKDSLGQNFIKYRGLVNELIAVSDINKEDTVVEIGPGKGIITLELAKVANEVIAVEKDMELYKNLKSKFQNPKIKIINEDFLEFELPKTKYKIFSNIPFSITSEIISKILQSDNLPASMYLIMQKETAEKLVGKPNETQSSILTKPFFEIEILGEIDRTNFTQKPQVRIMFVKFAKRQTAYIKDEDRKQFRDFVTYGFSQWQPTVMESFKKVISYDQSKNIKKMLKIGEVKPSELSFDKWLLLFKTWKRIANVKQRAVIS